ncbi:MAG: hypothetical protein HY263_09040 [Chloroflexi bacterium]|nr:hypothetical protein [Chloroflexota bacterium]
MKILERIVTTVERGRWAELAEVEERFEKIESAMGFPPARRYRAGASAHNMNTMVLEREWDSYAAREAAYERAMADEAWHAVGRDSYGIIGATQAEFYHPVDLAVLKGRPGRAKGETIGGRDIVARLPGGMDVIK